MQVLGTRRIGRKGLHDVQIIYFGFEKILFGREIRPPHKRIGANDGLLAEGRHGLTAWLGQISSSRKKVALGRHSEMNKPSAWSTTTQPLPSSVCRQRHLNEQSKEEAAAQGPGFEPFTYMPL